MAAAGSVTAMAEITKATGGRERRDAPTLLAQALATLAGRSGPGGHAVVFPSAVMTGALVQGMTGATDITARGKIEDFAPGAVGKKQDLKQRIERHQSSTKFRIPLRQIIPHQHHRNAAR